MELSIDMGYFAGIFFWDISMGFMWFDDGLMMVLYGGFLQLGVPQ